MAHAGCNAGLTSAVRCGRFSTENGTDALSASQDAVAHGFVNEAAGVVSDGNNFFQVGVDSYAVFFKEGWQHHRDRRGRDGAVCNRHDSFSRSGSKGLGGQFSVGFFEENFYAAFGFFQLLLGIRGRGPRLPQIVSWRRRERVAGFRDAGRLLPGGRGISRNPASWEARAFLRS